MTWATSKSQRPSQASHQGAPYHKTKKQKNRLGITCIRRSKRKGKEQDNRWIENEKKKKDWKEKPFSFSLTDGSLRIFRPYDDTHSIETVLQILNFDLFPGGRCAIWSSLLGSGSPPQLPVSRGSSGVGNVYNHHRPAPTQPFHVSHGVSEPYSVCCMRFSVLKKKKKMGFVFDDFAQLQANGSVLSVCKVG